jgi:hypothetical protein
MKMLEEPQSASAPHLGLQPLEGRRNPGSNVQRIGPGRPEGSVATSAGLEAFQGTQLRGCCVDYFREYFS